MSSRKVETLETVLPKFNIDFVVALLRQENAKDICVIQLPPEIKYCNYFIIVSGSSTRHLHAMAHYMLKMRYYSKCREYILKTDLSALRTLTLAQFSD
ncbi:hypothetical protein llap_21472 [Limosa lapponica baueri]|uniref:Uncharacterized protein n=1 Tax=Limosa lapponica baueri TaxID=1758121 RepID=A0A2I0T351_LIMLA|nr:hypothetical protein llap_21472 [Limosa lapponica baueri]